MTSRAAPALPSRQGVGLARISLRPSAAAAALLLAAALPLAAPPPAAATQVRIFQTHNQAGFLAGKLSGVSVDALGRMQLAPRARRVAAVGEPFLLSAAALPDGWVVGTGNAGKVLFIDRKGAVKELFAAPEPEVFALWADPDGTVWAGTSPHGKVYRISQGKAVPFFDPGETYIWALARRADGALLVATGTHGKLYRVDGKGHGEVAFESHDAHLRSLVALPGGDVLVGTAGQGLIVRLDRAGRAQTLFDADEPEVVALAAAPDGTCYAAAVASEASLLDLAKEAAAAAPGAAPAPGGAKPGGKPKPAVSVTVEEAAEAAPAASARRPGAPRSEVLKISPDGTVESVWSFAGDTVFSLRWQGDRLWVGTGMEGKLYSYRKSQMALEEEVDERQVVALLPGDAGPAFATTNGAALYHVTAGTVSRGTYTSAVLDAGQISRFGSLHWRGEVPAGAALRFSVRTGMSSVPDGNWGPWTDVTAPGQEDELPLGTLPRGRYVQWRAELEAGAAGGGRDGSPQLYGIELSYRQENLRPRITALVALEPGQILVPANFNPASQVYEPAHPNREGIFTTPGAPPSDEGGRVKPLWKKGYRTLRWTASDPNEDTLAFELDFRLADAPDSAPWLKMAGDVEEDHYSFDATALPDGVYRFRLSASDRPSNDPDTALTAERVSDPVVIDHTPPVLVAVEREGKLLRVKLHDNASPIREAVYSFNATPWKPARAADGLLDEQTETVLIDTGDLGGQPATPSGPPLLLLRVTDAAYNVVTFNLSPHLASHPEPAR